METGSKWVNHAWYQYVCFERCLKSEPGWKWVSHACLGIPSGVETFLEKAFLTYFGPILDPQPGRADCAFGGSNRVKSR